MVLYSDNGMRTAVRGGAFIAGLLLSACAGPILQGSAEDTNPEQATVVAEQTNYPHVELTEELFYDILLGEIARQRGEKNVASDSISRAATESKDPRLAEYATQLSLHAKQFPQALQNARLWKKLAPESHAPLEALGIILAADGKLEQADQIFIDYLASRKEQGPAIYRRIAELLVHQPNEEIGLELMDRITQRASTSPEAFFAQAYLAERYKKAEISALAIDQALVLRPNWGDAALAKISHLARSKEYAGLESFASDYLKRNPGAWKIRSDYARALVAQDKNIEAMGEFKRLSGQQPDNANIWMTLALLQLQAQQPEQAETSLKRHLKLRPNHDKSRLYLGELAASSGDYDIAEQWYLQIKDPDHAFDAQLAIAKIISARDGVDMALAHLDELETQSQEQEIDLALRKEQLLLDKKQQQRAKAVLDQALNQIPENSELLYARALLLAQMKLVGAHERDIRVLLKQDPNNAHALNALGYTLADLTDRLPEAMELITRALELRPEDPFIIDSMGWVLYRMGDYKRAVELLQKAIAKRPDAEIAAHLGEVLWVSGQREQATQVWDKAIKTSPDNDVLLETIHKHKQ